MSAVFRHVDAQRTIVFGRDALAASAALLGEGYTLLSTPRSRAAAPTVAKHARTVVNVPPGLVEDVAARLRPHVPGDRLVSLGGGRVIDVAKALAAADPPRQVVAIPTSLVGAEMTGAHRHATGVGAETPHVRPRVVINDPRLSASQPRRELAAGSANALGHAVVAVFGERTTPIAAAVAREAIARMAAGWSRAEPDREGVALAALLAGWAVDQGGLGPQHALAQSIVRGAGLAHAQAHAAILPEVVAAIGRRRPRELERLDTQLGVSLRELAGRLRDLARGSDEHPAQVDEELLDNAVGLALARPELGRIPPMPDRAEVGEMLRAAGVARARPVDASARSEAR